jgi:hypothetical protein
MWGVIAGGNAWNVLVTRNIETIQPLFIFGRDLGTQIIVIAANNLEQVNCLMEFATKNISGFGGDVILEFDPEKYLVITRHVTIR